MPTATLYDQLKPPMLGGIGPVGRRFIELCRPTRRRSMLRFACEEITIVDGPHAEDGIKFSPLLQPAAAKILEVIDDPAYYKKVVTGPNQFGKTLVSYAIPILYHLFECNQKVICGVAEMDMAADKWQEDLLPVIEETRYREFLPTKGAGSKGGTPTAIRFGNGATLRFMTAGGGDKKRSHYTAPILAVTELEAFDTVGHNSREGRKLAQLESRTLAFEAIGQRRHYYECTVGAEHGATWQHLQAGTNSRLALPCPHCAQYVTPEREHLVGWDAGETIYEASQLAVVVCPACGAGWSKPERHEAVAASVWVHEGQEVDKKGRVKGNAKRTDTISLRVNCVHNYLTTMAYVAGEEWRARYAGDDLDERAVLQKFWAMPQMENSGLGHLTAAIVASRCNGLPRRICPAGTRYLTLGADVRTQQIHWVALALTESHRAIVDYGVRTVTEYTRLGVEEALKQALHQLRREIIDDDEPFVDVDGNPVAVSAPKGAGLDTSAWTEAMFAWVREAGAPWAAVQGVSNYKPQDKRDRNRRQGFEAYWSRQKSGIWVLQINTDYYKRLIHDGFLVCRRGKAGEDLGPFDEHGAQVPGSMTLFGDEPRAHRDADTDRFAEQIVAEVWNEELSHRPGKSPWERIGARPNHYFDALVYALALAGQIGWRPEGRPADDGAGADKPKDLAAYMGRWGGKSWQ